MKPFPHVYVVSASGSTSGVLTVNSAGAREIRAAAPPEFDGPEGEWSPESLFCAAVASCFILTFRAVARASKLDWQQLECRVDGTLERVEGVTQFTRMVTCAKLKVSADVATELCTRALEKAEKGCLVANSLRSQRELQIEIVRG